LRTWVYRVAHNRAVSYGIGRRRSGDRNLVSLEEVELTLGDRDGDGAAGRREVLARLTEMIQGLKPLDRQVILSYLEGMDAAAIGEITGLAAGNVATKIHRIKTVLARRFSQGGQHA
jgi:RNA polymerase sigma-70 factor (ECF subfamily)